MDRVYKIEGGEKGRGWCKHIQRKGEIYWIVDTGVGAYSLCRECGVKRGLDRVWGNKKAVTADEMSDMWFGKGEKEELCKHLSRYGVLSDKQSLSTREKEKKRDLESAVKV